MKTYKGILFVSLLNLFINNIFAQAPIIQWQKSYGGSEIDVGNSIYVTNDNGFVLVGFTESENGDVNNHHSSPPGFTNSDVWILKIDTLGNLEWNNCLGGHLYEEGNSVIQTFDHGYILTGQTVSYDGDVQGLHNLGSDDAWIVKTDSLGNIQWQYCLGGIDYDGADEIIQTRDSGYLTSGFTWSNDGDITGNHGNQDVLVAKFTSNGTKQWVKVFGGTNSEEGYSCLQTSDGNFLIASQTLSNDGNVSGLHSPMTGDVWVMKLDSLGNLFWQKCYGGTNSEFPNKVLLSDNGSFFISASTPSNDGDVTGVHGNFDYWIFKADSSGVILWQKCLGGTYSEVAYSASTTSDGGIIIIGKANQDDGMVSGVHGSWDYWVVKLDSSGNYEWSKCLGGTNSDEPNDIKQTPDGGYIIAGSTTSTDGDITFNHGNKDFWVVKLAPLGTGISEIQNTLMDFNVSQNNDQLNLRFFSKQFSKTHLSLFNLAGKIFFEKELLINEGINYSQVNCTGLTGGIYFLEIEGNGISERVKVFFQ